MTILNPRIALVGFGAAGVACANTIRNHQKFCDNSSNFKPNLTIFEGTEDLGGKMAPRNLGAQFLDERLFYPMNRLVEDLNLSVLPVRDDYDDAPFTMKNGEVMEASDFMAALIKLRRVVRADLQKKSWMQLDNLGGVGYMNMLKRRGDLNANELEALVCRLKLEEGTTRISALSFAINLIKGETPMRRLELADGLHQIAVKEAEALSSIDAKVFTGKKVRQIDSFDFGVLIILI